MINLERVGFFIKVIIGMSGSLLFLSIEGAIEPIWWGGKASIFPMLCFLVILSTTLVIYRITAFFFKLEKELFIPVCYGLFIPLTMLFAMNNFKPVINILFTVLIISFVSSLTSGLIAFVLCFGRVKWRRKFSHK